MKLAWGSSARLGTVVILGAGLGSLLGGCSRSNGQTAAAAPPPPEVGVVTVAPARADLSTELPGRLEAYRVAQVRARAAGILNKRLFTEGSDVKAGQALFEIDAAPYRAALAGAQAQLARAEANLLQAEGLADRYAPLARTQAVSQQEALNAQAAAAQAKADVAAGKAAVQTAQINLGHASVTSPIAGRIGRALVTEGALVGQGEATPLALVQQIDRLYVNFTQSAAEVMRLRQALADGRLQGAGKDAAKVQLLLEDGSVYAQPGKLLFSDLSVDPGTGQITLRAELPNPKGLLLPGLYVRVRLAQAEVDDAVWLPQQAVARGATGESVLVVADDGSVSARPVRLGPAQDGKALVLAGLKAGEKVVVDGLQKTRAGGKARPVPWAAAAPASAASR
ncbi:efflux RND transporter periplasmic adaptor subunit [Pelomonas aquatica]|jgi:membrane fusion protein (multidrug efflux system)|uniref:Efflux RND transporter periplasmic adaptor subunit n=1 Tax=Pelomonas aquatica TaxID=431058 RepID=A0A9X4LEN2_9BURK|nr:efflux RND transporter periplasmic adaptor subunit [Pelomonas aquatica]MCY4755395.1 efflux RND transporter periplasmic adaptor subunit [Pelomonas aquatica]MDG0861739.1 efflux RND transporter periplasmic adaptor subunit [Pelomonas aquatica]